MNQIRVGNITSSTIVALTKNGKKSGEFGKPFYTYVKQKNQERKLARSISNDTQSKETIWGHLVESFLMNERPDILGFEYTLTPSVTLQHPNYINWLGSPDGFNNSTSAVIDIKCPFTLGSFANFADCKDINEVREEHDSGETYYWQLVSNACIRGVDRAELIIYCPTEEELKEIQQYAVDGLHEYGSEVFFIGNSDKRKLPYLPKASSYPNLVRFAFDVPMEDKQFLTERVEAANKLLLPNIFTANYDNELNTTIIQ